MRKIFPVYYFEMKDNEAFQSDFESGINLDFKPCITHYFLKSQYTLDQQLILNKRISVFSDSMGGREHAKVHHNSYVPFPYARKGLVMMSYEYPILSISGMLVNHFIPFLTIKLIHLYPNTDNTDIVNLFKIPFPVFKRFFDQFSLSFHGV